MLSIQLRTKRLWFCVFAGLGLLVSLPTNVMAQGASGRRNQRQQEQAQRNYQLQMQKAAENQAQLPSDPQLLSLHRDFIVKAEKLAVEYERKKQFDKAREVLEAMVRLVPKHAEAEAGLQRIRQMQTMADRKVIDVDANSGWQDTGVTLQEGMPVHIEVRGTWKVVLETDHQGIDIPEKLRPRDSRIKLGTLIGVVATSPSDLETAKAFPIQPGKDFVNKQTGRLYLRMFDIDPADNEGKIFVGIQSTFAN
ncbi:DUF4670 domain-containing protein [Stieleria sp. JC731]|uniref:DUF4670 domain-containing protein n=2 Tax=Pirellulaceae TaxID=2691357 RepID=UPI001E37A7B1|nr:DUF4670 domain-containing protein [Stieleria sp. JC731]MCC9598957.1 DUF4670 domain-containing protein [Stieleria sp. JC731]